MDFLLLLSFPLQNQKGHDPATLTGSEIKALGLKRQRQVLWPGFVNTSKALEKNGTAIASFSLAKKPKRVPSTKETAWSRTPLPNFCSMLCTATVPSFYETRASWLMPQCIWVKRNTALTQKLCIHLCCDFHQQNDAYRIGLPRTAIHKSGRLGIWAREKGKPRLAFDQAQPPSSLAAFLRDVVGSIPRNRSEWTNWNRHEPKANQGE